MGIDTTDLRAHPYSYIVKITQSLSKPIPANSHGPTKTSPYASASPSHPSLLITQNPHFPSKPVRKLARRLSTAPSVSLPDTRRLEEAQFIKCAVRRQDSCETLRFGLIVRSRHRFSFWLYRRFTHLWIGWSGGRLVGEVCPLYCAWSLLWGKFEEVLFVLNLFIYLILSPLAEK